MTTSISGPFGEESVIESAVPPNDEIVAIGTIDAENIHQRFSVRGINKLANTQERFAAGHVEQFGGLRIGCSCVNFLVGIAQLNAIISFQYSKEGIAVKRSGKKFGKLGRGNIAGLKCEWFFRS